MNSHILKRVIHDRKDNIVKSNGLGMMFKIVIALFLVIEIYPIIWLLLSSLKDPTEFTTQPVYALPQGLYIKNYIDAWTVGKMSTFLKNSAYATFTALFFIVSLSSLAAFGLTKMRWKLSKVTTTFFLVGIMIPVQVVLIPLVIMYKQVGLLNNLWGLILTYTAFGLPMSIYLFMGYFHNFPDEIIEAAVIDGCTIYGVFFHIVLPLIKNAMVTIITLQFLFTWNDLIFSMTFITRTQLRTIQTGLIMFTGEYGQKEWGPIFASVSMGTLPTLILYLILNKLVIKGMTAGAVKG